MILIFLDKQINNFSIIVEKFNDNYFEEKIIEILCMQVHSPEVDNLTLSYVIYTTY